MRESISTSEPRARLRALALAPLLGAATVAFASPAFAQAPLQLAAAPAADSKTAHPEEDDFKDTPFTEYGEFNEEAEEASETKFFQYGRFFGVSVGTGMEGALGNRGQLWSPAFPLVEIKVHYWFDFNLALDLGFYSARHSFVTSPANGQDVDVSLFWLGSNIKYYFDTKNVAAPISFLNPFLSAGIGGFTKNEHRSYDGGTSSDSAFGLSVGAGAEFVLSPRKTYLQIEAKGHMPIFQDDSTTRYASDPNNLDNVKGLLYTTTVSILFTW